MFRVLSGRPKAAPSLRKSFDLNQQPDQVAVDIDLAHTVDDEDDSGSKLYSDNEEEARDFQLQHVRRLQGRLSSTTTASRQEPQTSSSSIFNSSSSCSQRGTQKINRSTISRGRAKNAIKLTRPSPVQTVPIPPFDYENACAPDLDDIIRAFAKKRNPSRSKIIVPTKTKVLISDEEASSSSYHSGFSSSESSNSSGRSASSLAAKKSRQMLLDLWQKRRNPEDESKPITGTFALEEEYHLESAVDQNAKVDSLFARYGNTHKKRNPQRQTNRSANTRECNVISAPKRPEYDTNSSAGESDAKSRQSFSSRFSFSRGLGGKSIRKLWLRKTRIEQESFAADTTERTTESGITFPTVVGFFGRLTVNNDSHTATRQILSPPDAESTLTGTENSKGVKLVTPQKGTEGRFSRSVTAGRSTRQTRSFSRNSSRSNKDVSEPSMDKLNENRRGHSSVKTEPPSKSLKIASEKPEVRGFDCDTGDFATAESLSKSNVLKPNSRLSNALKKTSVTRKQLEVLDFEPRLEDPDLPLFATSGNDHRPAEGAPQTKHIIDPLDMQLFLAQSDADRTAKLLEDSLDDAVSSLSSNSTLTVNATTDLDENNDYRVHDNPAKKRSSIVRTKSLMSSQSLDEGHDPFCSSNVKADAGRLRSKSQTKRVTSDATPLHLPLKPRQTNPLRSQPEAAYTIPSNMQVQASHRSISILLIEPVLKVFEIVSVGIIRGTTVGDALKSACLAAADQTLSQQTYVSLCGETKVISNLKSLVSRLAPRKQSNSESPLKSILHKQRGGDDDEMRREMERRLMVAVPEKSNAAECQKIRRMLWKNAKLQVWWHANYKSRSQQLSVSSLNGGQITSRHFD